MSCISALPECSNRSAKRSLQSFYAILEHIFLIPGKMYVLLWCNPSNRFIITYLWWVCVQVTWSKRTALHQHAQTTSKLELGRSGSSNIPPCPLDEMLSINQDIFYFVYKSMVDKRTPDVPQLLRSFCYLCLSNLGRSHSSICWKFASVQCCDRPISYANFKYNHHTSGCKILKVS